MPTATALEEEEARSQPFATISPCRTERRVKQLISLGTHLMMAGGEDVRKENSAEEVKKRRREEEDTQKVVC